LNSLPFHYQVRRSERAKKARIIVAPGKIEVVAPFHISNQKLHQFVLSQQQWIGNALKKLESKQSQYKRLSPEFYHHGVEIPYLGAFYPLAIRPTKLKKIKIALSDEFTAMVPETMLNDSPSHAIRQALTAWMKKQMKIQVELIVQRHGPTNNLFPRSISIKCQKTRWGSCGIHNDININWLLILAPPSVLEYVVVHELCHIQFRNHSHHFWALVAHHLPDYQTQRYWLKQYGSSLMHGL
jgi:predicted metal-dependent hydrolase